MRKENKTMKKELLETIDGTIKTICNDIQRQKLLVEGACYPNDTIKALANLITARALLETKYYFDTDLSGSKE